MLILHAKIVNLSPDQTHSAWNAMPQNGSCIYISKYINIYMAILLLFIM